MEIIIEPIAGLANRLRATVSGMCAAEDVGRPLTIIWEKDRHCDADFADLFGVAAIYGAIPIRILKLEGVPRVPPGTA